MPNRSDPDQNLKVIHRVGIYAAAALLLTFCWFAVRTQIGSMLAEQTPASREDAADVAAIAIDLAPRDPRPRLLDAMVLRRSFSTDDMERSVVRLEEAVRLSPFDYRIWTDLARGYEQSERLAEAEEALKRSIELAPNYAIPHWQMGNFLLRQGRIDEAKVELKRVTETNSAYRGQVFALAWDYFGKDPEQVEELSSDSADARVNLTEFYAERGSGRNAARIWNTLTPEEKHYYEFAGKNIARRLYRTGSARDAFQIARDVGLTDDVKEETINNGGFERFIGVDTENLYGWNILRSDGKFEALPDTRIKAEGERSLKIVFRNYMKNELYNIIQVVTVEPGARYRLAFKVRTEELRSGGPPFLQIASYNSYQHLAATEPFSTGTHDWREIELAFDVPSGVESVELRTMRLTCGDECPISGTIWYDDFRLVRE